MVTLRKGDLASKVRWKLGGSLTEAQAALGAVLGSVQDAIRSGDRVVLTGFGTFEVRQVKSRKVRGIRGRTVGALITIPAHKRVGFTPGAELAKAARGRR